MSWFNQNSNVPVTRRTSPSRSGLEFRDSLFNLIDDMFKDFEPSLTPLLKTSDMFIPPLNVSETEASYHIETELPGVEKKDIDLQIQDDLLTIKGEKKTTSEEKKDRYYRMERISGSFARTIRLPGDADGEKVSAKLENGILRIDIAKNEGASSKKKNIHIH